MRADWLLVDEGLAVPEDMAPPAELPEDSTRGGRSRATARSANPTDHDRLKYLFRLVFNLAGHQWSGRPLLAAARRGRPDVLSPLAQALAQAAPSSLPLGEAGLTCFPRSRKRSLKPPPPRCRSARPA